MAQIIVRNLTEKVVKNLKGQAKKNGRSLEAEVRFILDLAASRQADEDRRWKVARDKLKKWREQLAGRKLPNSVKLIREGRR